MIGNRGYKVIKSTVDRQFNWVDTWRSQWVNNVVQSVLSTPMPWEIISKHTHAWDRGLSFSVDKQGFVSSKTHLTMRRTQRSQGHLKAMENSIPGGGVIHWLGSSMRRSRSRHTGGYRLDKWREANRGRGGQRDATEVLTSAGDCSKDGAAGASHGHASGLWKDTQIAPSDVWWCWFCLFACLLSPFMVFNFINLKGSRIAWETGNCGQLCSMGCDLELNIKEKVSWAPKFTSLHSWLLT